MPDLQPQSIDERIIRELIDACNTRINQSILERDMLVSLLPDRGTNAMESRRQVNAVLASIIGRKGIKC